MTGSEARYFFNFGRLSPFLRLFFRVHPRSGLPDDFSAEDAKDDDCRHRCLTSSSFRKKTAGGLRWQHHRCSFLFFSLPRLTYEVVYCPVCWETIRKRLLLELKKPPFPPAEIGSEGKK